MIGFIVKHSGFGLGKIHSSQNKQYVVFFFSPPAAKTMVATIGGQPVLKRALLPVKTLCTMQDGLSCRVIDAIPAISEEPHRYQVEFENGLAGEVSEIELIPDEIPAAVSPLEALADRQLEGYATFLKREALVDAWGASIRGALGLRALLSSRIDLRPHQAYVAGTVLLDRVPRYLLADEVGLGKTIEAGIVIHDLMERKPAARILILCPGTLTQQWLCELYAKFSGRVFHLVELRQEAAAAGAIPEKAIASFTDALAHGAGLLKTPWDLIIVDEAHHLLAAPRLYHLVRQLSEAAPGCLLLSAIPAQHREDEYLRLLALLEPRRYQPDAPGAQAHFKELYERQIELGRKLSYLSRRLAEFATDGKGADRIVQKIGELRAFPALAQDEALAAPRPGPSDPLAFMEGVRALLHHVGDRYRISRRILRNRRSQLIEAEPDLRIVRRLQREPHQPDQLELDAGNAARRLVQSLAAEGLDEAVLLPLSRHLFHALCDPACLGGFLALAESAKSTETGWVEFDGQISYQSWGKYAPQLWGAAAPLLPAAALRDLKRAAENWQASDETPARLASLTTFLRQRHKKVPAQKFLVFAGFFGLAESLAESLAGTFGKASVARFTWEMETRAKEKGVMRFQRDSECWLMVSDETGGEGRNFQFVHELVHFDLPWHVSKIEQRIGRLDRLGRKMPEVCSNVFYADGEEEDGLLGCLELGFEIFVRSISGLEFAVAGLERRLAQVAIADGCEGLGLLVEEIKSGAEAERAEDDVQGVLDAASLERTSAEVFRRAQSTPERDLALEKAFCEWFRFIAGNSALRFPPAGDSPDQSVVEFRPNQLATLVLAPGPKGVREDRVGTFRRQIAQERPDLEFFSVGNAFFDAVCLSLHESVKGRTYAVECQSAHAPWRGFEFVYRPASPREMLRAHPGLMKHLDRVLASRLEHCFIGENLQPPGDRLELLSLRKALTNEGHDVIWRNFTLNNTRVQLLADHYVNPGWETLVERAEAQAGLQARAHFSLSLAPALESERARIAEQIRQARLTRSDEWQEEVAGLEALLEAINRWDLELDSAGFLSVNGGIIP